MAVITSDITLRKRAEKLLIEENEKLLVTLRALSDGVITADKDGRVILINDAAEKLLDCTKEEIIGRSVAELFLIIDQKTGDIVKNPIYWVLEKKTSLGLENNKAIIIKSKKNIMMEYNAAPIFDIEKKIIGVVLVFRDITENLRIQDELKKSQKLESIGILAGGIAHDFNNILVSILGNISLAKINTDIEDSNYHFLIDAEKGTVRAKELTQQLLTFAKGGDPVKETSSIEEIIKDSTIFVLRGSNVACSFSFLDDIWSVDIDKGQINQVIQNLIINAIQSMPSGGKIDINVENVILEEHSSIQLASGKYILISIRDRGTGISKEYIDKIFDPFFTTKTKGTGLGLSIVYSIIKKHNGAILVESTIGLGTTFFVYLPASIKQTNHIKTNKEKNEKIKNMTFSQKERILVMDDEESIRLVVGKMLNHLGYEVDFASDGEEAIDLYKKAIEYNKPFNCVIMDLTIPGGLGGKEAIEKLKEIDPTIKAIVSSGYSNDPVISNFKQYGFSEIIAKPFVMEELSEVLHKVISGDKYRSTNI
ncbi:MAG: hypothetical protein A2086_08515 [Spirochaetes bacterium GWD1_27_9]|nr:MAG: hypothetical protein A2Z98_18090 [Spirochaetes bacterium GWB1_27_13]OHD23134.1 MAG: hypothetical protein A2Y34_16690 [Spirochaetes bacterium GWC1_27_15]OHD40285.1 MAG: hypothetical protein A2086_08515 [Spirochaetes bacterium GWD1_27_9]